MDITQAMKDTENALRDFITEVLSQQYGENWVQKCGVTDDRMKVWQQRKENEHYRHESCAVEERLIYYSDFYDLQTILAKNWQHFASAFGDLKTFRVLLSQLEKFRDPDAHRRELMLHQKHLALGICGEIRNKIIQYRSKQETEKDYYPRIESIRDSLGNVWMPYSNYGVSLFTGLRLRVGDAISFQVAAFDPLGEQLLYKVEVGHRLYLDWQKESEFDVILASEHVQSRLHVSIDVKSEREYHAHGFYDDTADFVYDLLPPKR